MKCPRTVNAGHDKCGWEGDDPAEHAAETGHGTCLVCSRFLRDEEIRTCGKCVGRAHDDLDVIETAYAMLAPVAEASGYHTGSLPGGDALVMLADGSLDGGGPDDHVKFRDPIPVLAQLYFWERDWRETFGHGHPARWQATVDGCLEYLRQWMWHASRNHDAFDDYVNEIRALRYRVAHVVGIADDPEKADPTCFEEGCGGKLLRHYSDEGLEDDWTCQRCGGVYTQTGYFLALRAHYATEVRPEWRSMPLAAWLVDYSLRTLQRWVSRDEVTHRRDEATGRKEVWMPDVQQAAAEARRQREERAAKAAAKREAEADEERRSA